jgi:serine O-acetyltransferase
MSLLEKIYNAHKSPVSLPGNEAVEKFINQLMEFLFPELNNKRLKTKLAVETQYKMLHLEFETLLYHIEACDSDCVHEVRQSFFSKLEQVYEDCLEDGIAILQGDPAAIDSKEVIRTYPGFYAIAIYRIAHLLLELDIPYLPRIFMEFVHSKTGIDIHPGAKIGKRFCIDHGTGVVIGETTEIGNNVKIYQSVTLGALSVEKQMANKKRHPTIEDNVVIYAGATILGGQTVIGSKSVIGGNTWVTKSVSPGSKIYYNQNSVERA